MKRSVDARCAAGYPALALTLALALALGGVACIPIPVAGHPASTPVCLVRHEKPWTAPEFIAAANDARDRALEYENARLLSPQVGAGVFVAPWSEDLRDASDCYERALRVNPGSYDARIGLGTVYLMVGLRAPKDNGRLNPFFLHARQHLGRAYFLRADKFDPLFYLTLIAIAERQLPTAQYLLAYLQRHQPNDGEVLTLGGYYAEQNGNPVVANQYYSTAFNKGASADTLTFLNAWLRNHP